jgi:protein-S-isoprenylcysteine O-methyltransferase Ste14
VARLLLLGAVSSLGFLAVIGGVMFACAGRWDLPFFWAYLGIWAAGSLISLFLIDPTLIKERMRPGPGGRDYLGEFVLLPLWLAQHALAGLDVGRFHWSDNVPLVVQALALAAVAASFALLLWAVAVNRFFSSVIRIQTDRGHQLVTSGPYGFVRHPAYAAAPFLMIGSGLALGSWIAGLVGLLMFLPILRRAALEDRILQEHLAGYADYARRVRYRLLPGVW